MHKLAIIDDDAIIRKGLSGNLAWLDHNLELVGTAKNGVLGLSLVHELRPDIIITDIRMPFMDGLALTKSINDSYPETKIIMMTSYEDFQYAKEALKMKVFDYLLKPICNDVLMETVKRAAAELVQESNLKKKMLEGIPLLKQRFFESLVRGKIKEEEITSQALFLDLQFHADFYMTVILKADDYINSSYVSRFDKEMLKYCIHNVAEEIVNRERAGYVFDAIDDEVILIYKGTGTEESLQTYFFKITEEIRTSVEQYLKSTVTAGMGFIYERYQQIAQSYKDARSALEFSHILGKNKVLSIRDTVISQKKEQIELYGAEKEIVLKVKLGFVKHAITLLDEVERKCMDLRNVSLQQFQMKACEIVVLLNAEMDLKPLEQNLVKAFYEHVHKLQTVKEIFAELRILVHGLSEVVNNNRENHQKQLVMKAIEYMENNYHQERLTLNEVASTIYITPTYFSFIFKQEQKENFSDYLLDLRMKKSMELLRMKNLKSYEVAELVGYTNPQYFSTCFKKYTGMSPSEFKGKGVSCDAASFYGD